jgi:CRISPR-associated protein Cas2
MMSTRHWHLISYDVRDPQRLRKVARTLEGYGSRIQYSVFRCRLDRTSLEKLRWELNQILDSVDDLLVIPLCEGCACQVPVHSTGDQSSWAAPLPTFRIV